MRRFRSTVAFASSLLVTVIASPAFALEADAVAERLKELLVQQNIEFTYGSAQLDGSDVVLNDLSFKDTAADDGLSLDELTLQNVTETNEEYRVGEVALDSYESTTDDLTVSLTDMNVSGLVLPKDNASDPFGGYMRYDRIEVAQTEIANEDGPVATMGNLYADMNVTDGDTLEGTAGVETFTFALASLVEDQDKLAMLDEMAYDELSGSAIMEGTWRPSDGRMNLSRYEIVFDDAGTLNISLDLSGYTPEFIHAMEEAAAKLEQQADDGNQSMQGMAMLGLMQQLTFHGATVRYNDDSLTTKVLNEVAEREGTTPENLIEQAKTAIPQQLSPFVGSDLAENVSQAVGNFLANPENIEISAQPANPLPFAMLMGAAMGSPEMLVQQLGLSITANQ